MPTFQWNCKPPSPTLIMEAISPSELSAHLHQTTSHHISQDRNLHHHCMKTSHLASISTIWYSGKQTFQCMLWNSGQCISPQRNKRSGRNIFYSQWSLCHMLYVVKIHHCLNLYKMRSISAQWKHTSPTTWYKSWNYPYCCGKQHQMLYINAAELCTQN